MGRGRVLGGGGHYEDEDQVQDHPGRLFEDFTLVLLTFFLCLWSHVVRSRLFLREIQICARRH